eukprot:1674507-Pyramimonas_sp.AAC.1
MSSQRDGLQWAPHPIVGRKTGGLFGGDGEQQGGGEDRPEDDTIQGREWNSIFLTAVALRQARSAIGRRRT